MHKLDRYILREIALPFATGLGLFFVVVAFAQVLQISDAVTGLGVSGGEILQALAFSLPPLMGLLIPLAILFATLLGVGRLAADREVLGTQAAGVSPFTILRMPIAVGLVLTVFSALALIVGEPWGVRGLRNLMAKSAQRAVASGVRSGEFTEWTPGVTFIATDRRGDELQGVFFADRREADKRVIISARRGRLAGGSQARDLVLDLKDGMVVAQGAPGGNHRVIRFAQSQYRLDIGALVGNKAKTLGLVQEMSLRELWRRSRDTSLSPRHQAMYTVVFHRKLALPLATVIFAALAVPLALQSTRGARARGFLYSAGIASLYYYVSRVLDLMAQNGKYPAVLAAWTPTLLGAVALTWLLWRLGRGRA